MTTRRADYLITDVRDSTENGDFSDTIGIQDVEFLRYLNDAQFRIQSLITAKHQGVFVKELEVSSIIEQESYDLPKDIYLGNKVTQIEYSFTGNKDDYYPLESDVLKNRNSNLKGDPSSFVRIGSKFIVKPVPQSAGSFRITYINRIPKMDLNRATILTATLDSATRTITSLFLDPAVVFDSTEINKYSRICIIDVEGTVTMSNIFIDTVNASTGEVTVNSAFSYDIGESITVGDTVVIGPNSSTHSALDEMVERYLIAYATSKIMERDSSGDLQAQSIILRSMEQDIVASYSEIDDFASEIPVIISNDDSWDIF